MYSSYTFGGHTYSVRSVAMLDSSHFISGSRDKTIKLWNRESSTCLRTYEGHTEYVQSVAMLDSSHFISGSDDYTIKLWNKNFEETRDVNPLQIVWNVLCWQLNGPVFVPIAIRATYTEYILSISMFEKEQAYHMSGVG